MKKSISRNMTLVHRTSRGEAKLVRKPVSVSVQDEIHDPTIKAGHLSPRVPSSVPTKQLDNAAESMKASYDRSHRHEK